MFVNILRQHIEQKNKLCGTVVTLADPCICELFGYAGFDFVWIDTEHSYMSYKDVLCHINGAKSANICSIVRVPQNDLTATKKILELGPDGIIFPMVKNAKEAKELIEMTLYPPLGTRGFGPIRAIRYGTDNAKEYTDKKSLEMCRFIQVEHIDCINQLEEICKNPYIDGFIFGPNDLSASLGEICNVQGRNTADAMNRAIKILRENNKYIGLAVGHSDETLKYWSQFDFDLIAAGGDFNFLNDLGTEISKKLKNLKL